MFLEVDSLDEIKKKLDKYYKVMILCAIHPDFNHIKDQLLTSHEVPSMDTLITRMICVPTPQTSKTLTVSGVLSARTVKGWVIPKKTVTLYIVFLPKQPMSPRQILLTPSSLRTSIKSTYDSSPTAWHSHLKLKVHQVLVSLNPWKVAIQW